MPYRSWAIVKSGPKWARNGNEMGFCSNKTGSWSHNLDNEILYHVNLIRGALKIAGISD